MLIVDSDSKMFNLEEIHRGTLICARHSTWADEIAGIVTGADEICLRVQFSPSVQNTLNHYFIYAEEVVRGEWTIRYSDNLGTVSKYPEDEEEGADDGS